MKYYLIAGEASGDLHGANLIKELKDAEKEAQFRFFGGGLMQAESDNLVKHYKEMAFMGLWDVVYNIRTIRRNMELCKMDILAFNPDVLILIDYPGFNMRMAEFAKKSGIKVFYFISPKIWAWKEWRIKKIKAYVDEMFTILPFETGFYKKHNYNVHYVGNPLVEKITTFQEKVSTAEEFRKKNKLDECPIVSLLAGSRKGEIKMILPLMLELSDCYPDFQFIISQGPSVPEELYKKVLGGRNIPLFQGETYELVSHSHAALVTSGTATLETALLNTPQIVLYKFRGNKHFGKWFRKTFIKIKYVSLPNLVVDKEAVKEFIMEEMTLENVKPAMDKLLNDQGFRNKIYEDYAQLKELMGGPGAAKRAALKMVELLVG